MAVDRRQKNSNWTVCGDDGRVTYEGAQLAVPMDIRDELKQLNALLYCDNFIAIPRILRRVSANTAKPRKASK